MNYEPSHPDHDFESAFMAVLIKRFDASLREMTNTVLKTAPRDVGNSARVLLLARYRR